MAVTKLTMSGFTAGSYTKYDDFLAGNSAYIPSSFESIATATGTGSSGTITFSGIPSTYKHLQIRGTILLSSAGSITFTWNGLSSNYAQHSLRGSGTAASASGSTARSSLDINLGGAGESTNPYVSILDFHDYADTSKTKVVRQFLGYDKNATGGEVALMSGMNTNTSAISSITFSSNANFTTGTSFALYGIRGE